MLCWSLPYIPVDYPTAPTSPSWTLLTTSTPSPHPTPLGCHRAAGWAPSHAANPRRLSILHRIPAQLGTSAFAHPFLPQWGPESHCVILHLLLSCRQAHQCHPSRSLIDTLTHISGPTAICLTWHGLNWLWFIPSPNHKCSTILMSLYFFAFNSRMTCFHSFNCLN